MRQWLKERRSLANLNQEQVAEKLGVKQYDYSRIENGTRQKKISLEMATKLSDLFGISIEEIRELENID